MWKWLRRRELTPHVRVAPQWTASISRKYVPLYDYLANRYADTVVLTFGQLEDLLGNALPNDAHSQDDWWTSTDSRVTASCSDAWILAGRTARPNLPARTVTFERVHADRTPH